MGGKFSRNKGRRGEQQLVLYLSKLGYKAERILRQYQFSGQPDVKAVKNDISITFELKCRQKEFPSLYKYYLEEGNCPMAVHNGIYAVFVCKDFKELENMGEPSYTDTRILTSYPLRDRALNKLFKVQEWVQQADYLVLKDNNKPYLFIKYRPLFVELR